MRVGCLVWVYVELRWGLGGAVVGRFCLVVTVLYTAYSAVRVSTGHCPAGAATRTTTASSAVIGVAKGLAIACRGNSQLFMRSRATNLRVVNRVRRGCGPKSRVANVTISTADRSKRCRVFPITVPRDSNAASVPRPVSVSSMSSLGVVSGVAGFVDFSSVHIGSRIILDGSLIRFSN